MFSRCVPGTQFCLAQERRREAFLKTLHTVSYLILTATLGIFISGLLQSTGDVLRTSNLTSDSTNLDLNPAFSAVQRYAISVNLQTLHPVEFQPMEADEFRATRVEGEGGAGAGQLQPSILLGLGLA